MKCFGILAVVVLIPQLLLAQEIDQTLLQKLRSEAPKGWRRCETAFQNLACRVTVSRRSHGNEVLDEHQFELSSILERSEFLLVSLDSATQREIHRDVINSRYSFSVRSLPDAANWSLSKGKPGSAPLTLGIIVESLSGGGRAMLNMVSVVAKPLTEIFGDSQHFTLLKCKAINLTGNDSVVRCEFRCRHPDPRFAAELLEVDLIPQKNWIIKRVRMTNEVSGNGYEMIHEFQIAPNGVACLSKATVRELNSELGVTTVIGFGTPVASTRPSEEFYLPFYGISESAIFPPAPARDWFRYLLIGGGVVSVLLGIFLWKRQSS